MSSSGGQISVEIALQGADSFGGAIDGVSGKLKTLQDNSGTTGTALTGLGTNATQANTGVNSLGTGSASLGTKMLAVGGAVTSLAGGVIGLTGNYLSLEKAHTAVDRANKMVEISTNSVATAQDALNKYIAKGSLTQADYEKALQKVSDASKKVGDDEQKIADDENKLNDLRAKGKTNTQAYADAVHKLGDDQASLQKDTGALSDSQKAYSDLVQKHVDTTAPKYIELVNKLKAAQDGQKVSVERAKDAQDSLNQAQLQFNLSIAQTTLQGIGSISTAFALLTKNSTAVTPAIRGVSSEIGMMPARAGPTGWIIMGIAIAIGIIYEVIKQNVGALEKWGKNFGDQVPVMKPWLDLLHGIGAEIGLTGQGFGKAGPEITGALKEIQQQIGSSNIGKGFSDIGTAITKLATDAMPDLQMIGDKIIAFFKDPFGAKGGTYSMGPDTQIGPSEWIQSQIKNSKTPAADLGQAILKALTDGFHYAMDNLPKAIDFVGKALNDALKKAMPTLDAVGASILKSLDDLIKNPGHSQESIIKFLTWLFSDLSKIKDAVNTAIDNLLATAFDPKNSPKTRQAFINLLTDLGTAVEKGAGAIWKGLTNADTWKTILSDIGTQLLSLGTWMVTNAYKLLKPLGSADTWKQVLGDIETQLLALGTWMATNAYNKILKPLGNADTWKQLLGDVETQLANLGTWLGQNAYDKILKPLGNAQNWKQLLGDIETQLANLGTWLVQNAYDKILKPLGSADNWKKLLGDIETQLQNLGTWLGTNAYDKILKPLGDANNWKKLLGDMETQIENLGTWLTTNAYDKILKPIGSEQTWRQLLGDVETELSKLGDWMAQNAYDKILKPLGSTQTWSQLGTDIAKALEGALVQGVNAAITAINNVLGAIPGAPKIPLLQVPGQGGGGGGQQGPPQLQQQQAPQFRGSPSGAGTGANPFGPPAAAVYAPYAPVNTAPTPVTILLTLDGKNVATSLKPYQLNGSGALT